jgi:hypothetical protein
MESWTGAQCAVTIKLFYKNNNSYVATEREFRKKFGIHRNSNVPSAHALKTWINNFEETGSTVKKKGGSGKTVRTPQNIDAVRASFQQSPRWSAMCHSKKLGLSESSVRHILHLDLHFHLYKIQVVQKLEEGDAAKGLVFSQQMLGLINRNKEVLNNLIMSDEAHFHLTGLVNKQNCRYWSDRHPRELLQKSLHSSKVTVWCAVAAFAIIGPYFFEDERGNVLTSERYEHMLQDFFIPHLQGLSVNKTTYFQQDGATSNTERIAMNILHPLFPGQLISRYGNIGSTVYNKTVPRTGGNADNRRLYVQ